MKIKDIMTKEVISASSETAISKVADILYTNRFHGMPVTDGKKVVGLITESDFFLKKYDDIYFPTYIKFIKESRAAHALPDKLKKNIEALLKATAKDMMTANPETFSPEDDVALFLKKVKKTKFTTYPVVNKARTLVGIVTLADYLGTVRKTSHRMQSRIQHDPAKNIDRLTSELDNFWQDHVTVVSKKKIQTWKGLTFLGVLAVVLLIISIIFITKNQVTCETDEGNFTPLECQQYTYGPWSQCDAQKIQTRKIEQKFPPNCSGGSIPVLIQPCQ